MARKDKRKETKPKEAKSFDFDEGFSGIEAPKTTFFTSLIERVQDLPPQQQIVMAAAVVVVILNFGSDVMRKTLRPEKGKTISHYEATGGRERWGNPNISWWERYLCKGGKNSFLCDPSEFRHPWSSFTKTPLMPEEKDSIRYRLGKDY